MTDGPTEVIAELFASEGLADYLGEDVTQAVHMLQTAALAERGGAGDALIAAALLHDVGHFTGTVTGQALMAGTDNRHGDQGAAWLARWFGPEVTEPVRLHVDAKRYLCATEPGSWNCCRPPRSTPWACRAARCTATSWPGSRPARTRPPPARSAGGTTRPRTPAPPSRHSTTSRRCSGRWPAGSQGRPRAAAPACAPRRRRAGPRRAHSGSGKRCRMFSYCRLPMRPGAPRAAVKTIMKTGRFPVLQ
jgi:hypothetical protein